MLFHPRLHYLNIVTQCVTRFLLILRPVSYNIFDFGLLISRKTLTIEFLRMDRLLETRCSQVDTIGVFLNSLKIIMLIIHTMSHDFIVFIIYYLIFSCYHNI